MLLAAQLALLAVMHASARKDGDAEGDVPLLTFDPSSIDTLRIEDGEGEAVELALKEGKWVLPGLDDYPAEQKKTDAMLEKLSSLERGWPVATTAGAARRFRVADEDFERKIVLNGNGSQITAIVLGSSPGFRRIHARAAGENEIYSVAFSAFEAGVDPADWIDRRVLALKRDDIRRVELPEVTISIEDGKPAIEGLGEGESVAITKVDALLGKLSTLEIQSVLGKAAKPEYRQDEPLIDFTVSQGSGAPLTYSISRATTDEFYVLKRSDNDYYFKIADWDAKPILEASRASLVEVEQAKEPESGLADKNNGEARQTHPEVENETPAETGTAEHEGAPDTESDTESRNPGKEPETAEENET
jgi:hypothetical protein